MAQGLVTGLAFGQVLTHGPVVGGVTPSSANVFVRTSEAASVALRYSTDPKFKTYFSSPSFTTESANDFTKIIALASLPAEKVIYLNVTVNDQPQFFAPPYPSFRTFPVSGALRNFSFVVLTDFTTTTALTQSVQTFASAAAKAPAFVFIGGDFDHRNPVALSAKRQMFRDLYDLNTPYMEDFVPLILRRTPIAHQWDDHDAGLNNIDKTYVDWDLSQQAFQEYIPTYPLPAVSPGIWQKFSYAQAEFFVLDCRSQRDPEDDVDDSNKSMLDGNNLGVSGQLQWLKDGLLTSTARWKIIFTSVITNPTTKETDGWGGYQTEWNALRDFINANHIRGVVFISGDLHLSAIDNGAAAGFPEMSVTKPNDDDVPFPCATADEGIWSEGYYEETCTGFGLVTISKRPPRLTLQAADQYGNIHVSYTVSK